MKLHKIMLVCAAMAMFVTGCKEDKNMPGDNDNNQAEKYVVPAKADPEGVPEDVMEDAITVTEALDICRQLASGAESDESYKVKGWVCNYDPSSNKTAILEYGNANFYLAVNPESRVKDALYCYQSMGLDGKSIFNVNGIQKGDYVVVQCYLTNYNGTLETTGKGQTMMLYSSNEKVAAMPENLIEVSCAEARLILDNLAANKSASDFYSVTGYVTTKPSSYSFWIGDAVDDGEVVQAYSYEQPDGLAKGMKVRVWGALKHYVNKSGDYTPEITHGGMEILEEAEE